MTKFYPIINAALLTAAIAMPAATVKADQVEQPLPGATARSTQSATAGIIDDNEAGWIWHGMVEYDDAALQGGSGHAGGPGTYGAYTFHGTGVDVICMTAPSLIVDGRAHKMGRARFSIDGKQIDSASAVTSAPQYGAVLLHVLDLSDSNHVLQIEPEGGWVVVDAIKVTEATPEGSASSSSTGSSKDKDAPFSIVPAGDYRIVLRLDVNKYLTARGQYPMDGTTTEIDGLTDQKLQVWHVQPLDNGRFRISAADAPDESLSVLTTMVKSTGFAVGTWRYGGLPSEQWIIEPTGGGYFRLMPASDPSLVIDLLWANDSDGTDVVNFAWHEAVGQQWAFKPVQ